MTVRWAPFSHVLSWMSFGRTRTFIGNRAALLLNPNRFLSTTESSLSISLSLRLYYIAPRRLTCLAMELTAKRGFQKLSFHCSLPHGPAGLVETP